jgi:hypothetical protein
MEGALWSLPPPNIKISKTKIVLFALWGSVFFVSIYGYFSALLNFDELSIHNFQVIPSKSGFAACVNTLILIIF